jgi:hypothetical protein
VSAQSSDVPSGLIAQAAAILRANGYQDVAEARALTWPAAAANVFEDPLGVVGIVVFDTWQQLSATWLDAQATMVGLLSAHLDVDQPKSWEGYLVLLTPGSAGPNRQALEDIRYDVSRLRKIVGDSVELEDLDALPRLLAPLLPLSGDPELDTETPEALTVLRSSLAGGQFDSQMIGALVDAFEQQAPMMDALDSWRRANADS